MKPLATYQLTHQYLNALRATVVRAQKEYSWGMSISSDTLSLETFMILPPMTQRMLRDWSTKPYPITGSEVIFSPSTFNANDLEELFLLPRKLTPSSTLHGLLNRFKPQAVLYLLPTWWQLQSSFLLTCRESNVPSTIVQPTNLPVARKIIEETGVQGVVTTQEIAAALLPLLEERKLLKPILFWQLIESMEATILPIQNTTSLICTEKQCMPGVELGYQCLELALAREGRFHPSLNYAFENMGSLYITGITNEAIPFLRYDTGVAATLSEDSCICGIPTFISFP